MGSMIYVDADAVKAINKIIQPSPLKDRQIERPYLAHPQSVLGVILQRVSGFRMNEDDEPRPIEHQPGHDRAK